jgi:hypothetical protein
VASCGSALKLPGFTSDYNKKILLISCCLLGTTFKVDSYCQETEQLACLKRPAATVLQQHVYKAQTGTVGAKCQKNRQQNSSYLAVMPNMTVCVKVFPSITARTPEAASKIEWSKSPAFFFDNALDF